MQVFHRIFLHISLYLHLYYLYILKEAQNHASIFHLNKHFTITYLIWFRPLLFNTMLILYCRYNKQ